MKNLLKLDRAICRHSLHGYHPISPEGKANRKTIMEYETYHRELKEQINSGRRWKK
jgi:hypothetical protein